MKNNYIGPKKLAKLQQMREEYRKRMEAVKAEGYEIFQSVKAGPNSSWSFRYNNEKSAYGFDSESEALQFIEKKIKN